jgi:hypothetical protein
VATTNADTEFDATDEAFFNAAYDDAPVSEPPITLDLEAEAAEAGEWARDPAASERLQARRARLTQTVAEIVATLALVAGTAGCMHLVRGPAASSPRAVAPSGATSRCATTLSRNLTASSVAQLPVGDRRETAHMATAAVASA